MDQKRVFLVQQATTKHPTIEGSSVNSYHSKVIKYTNIDDLYHQVNQVKLDPMIVKAINGEIDCEFSITLHNKDLKC